MTVLKVAMRNEQMSKMSVGGKRVADKENPGIQMNCMQKWNNKIHKSSILHTHTHANTITKTRVPDSDSLS